MRTALLSAAEQHESAGFPPEALGLIAFGVLVVLLLVTFAFRSTFNRH